MQFVPFSCYSCSVGSRGCSRARGTGLIELVTVTIRLISHIGYPSVCPGGLTVWQKGSSGGSAGQRLLLLNARCHSSPLSCRVKDCSEAENQHPLVSWTSAIKSSHKLQKPCKWCASGQCGFLKRLLVLTLVVVGAQQGSLRCSQMCCRARGWLDTCCVSCYRNKQVTDDSRQCGSCYTISGLSRVRFTISMFNNLEHRCWDHQYLGTTMQELTQTLKEDVSHNIWLYAAGICKV